MRPFAPKPLLHAEGLAVLVGASLAYRHLHASWLIFAALFLAPDLLMLGYLCGSRAGAWMYNLGHTYLAPLAVAAVANLADAPSLYPFCLIWVGHIGFDRFLGYGLKYETGFKNTHLGKV